MLVLNGDDVRRAFPMADAVDVVRDAMRALAEGSAYQPLRMAVQPPALPGTALLKPAQVGSPTNAFGLKSVTIFPGNTDRGLDVVQGLVTLLDDQTGLPLALLEGGVVTEIRTSAASGVATDLLALPDAGDLALIGAGTQARGHLLAMAQVREVRRVRVWNRSAERAHRFRSWAEDEGFDVEIMASVRAAVDDADLVCTVTSAIDPLLDADWLRPGAHVNAVGAFRPDMRELHTNVLQRAGVVAVDSRESALAEAGDVLIPLDEQVQLDLVELGELVVGGHAGRDDDDQITVFKSVGLAIQDVASAAFIYEQARSAGLGVDVNFP
ncbi:ornithine cyclodeaminase family protein [Phytoactinopolyspora limicola]|uniref:ornithine cyclodeaminase family protein n=1 Tax=Phytoactinopolyspora limicola TaxID=2715536 RepID=UPI001408B706|nr:ornithine cyclodeaminase family protein [Phytoactinopolyspora limicola]